jgi:hypothetical protein
MLMKRSFLPVLCFVFFIPYANTQHMVGAETRYNNSFREWILLTEDEDIEGELRLRWTFSNDWSAWDLSVGDITATIEQKWTDDPNLWVIRCEGVTVNAKTAKAGEFHRWKLSDGNHQINWESKYSNIKEEWEIDSSEDLIFQMYTRWEGDPRDWTIVDELPEDISQAMKVAMIFLTLHFSTPRI